MKPALLLCCLLALAAAPTAQANDAAPVMAPGAGHISPYAGEQKRAIKSLSPVDIDELRRGGGWGLAKAAELNGMPGPAHLLELKAEIPLSEEQVAQVEALYAAMRARAIIAGETLIGLEAALEAGFRDRTITDTQLHEKLAAIADARRELRYIHLSTHLTTPALLTPAQITRYNALRGYGSADPCTAIPDGHDAALWRRHNGCS